MVRGQSEQIATSKLQDRVTGTANSGQWLRRSGAWEMSHTSFGVAANSCMLICAKAQQEGLQKLREGQPLIRERWVGLGARFQNSS